MNPHLKRFIYSTRLTYRARFRPRTLLRETTQMSAWDTNCPRVYTWGPDSRRRVTGRVGDLSGPGKVSPVEGRHWGSEYEGFLPSSTVAHPRVPISRLFCSRVTLYSVSTTRPRFPDPKTEDVSTHPWDQEQKGSTLWESFNAFGTLEVYRVGIWPTTVLLPYCATRIILPYS